MKKIKEIIFGIIIGLSNVIPGVSGGTFMVLFGIYDKILDAISGFFKHPIKSIASILYIIIGLIVGIIFGIFIISALFEILPISLCFLFMGLILGSIPKFSKKLHFNLSKPLDYVIMAISAIVVIIIPILRFTLNLNPSNELSFWLLVLMFILGAISSASMVLPGISGSMILLALGFYNFVISDVLKTLIGQIITFNFDNITKLLLVALFFGIGIIIGLVLIAKLVKYLLINHERKTNYAIFGLLIGSVFAVFITTYYSYLIVSFKNIDLIIGIIAFIIATGGSYMLFKEKNYQKLALKEEKAIDDLISILRIPSILDEYDPKSNAPFGENTKLCLEKFLEIAANMGFKTVNLDNYCGYVEYGSGDLVGVLAHLDVVPVSNTWSSNPFEPIIKDGKIYARGTIDDKGPAMACLYALKLIKDQKIKINKKIRLIVGLDEESGSRCMEYYLKNDEVPVMSFSPDADFPVINGEKAIFSYKMEGEYLDSVIQSFNSGLRLNIVPSAATATLNCNLDEEFKKYLEENNLTGEINDNNTYVLYGVASHAMAPQNGRNAALYLMDFIAKNSDSQIANYISNYYFNEFYGKKLGFDVEDELMGVLTINVGLINYDGKTFTMGCNLRMPIDSQKEVVETKVKESLINNNIPLQYIDLGMSGRHFVSPDSDLVKTLLDVYKDFNLGDAYAFSIGGGTYAREFPNAVAFGPSMPNSVNRCHEDDEFIGVDEYYLLIALYAKTLEKLGRL